MKKRPPHRAPRRPFHPLFAFWKVPARAVPTQGLLRTRLAAAHLGPPAAATPGSTALPRGPGVPGLTQPRGRGSPTHAPCSSRAGRPAAASLLASLLAAICPPHRLAQPPGSAELAAEHTDRRLGVGRWVWVDSCFFPMVCSRPPSPARGGPGLPGGGQQGAWAWVLLGGRRQGGEAPPPAALGRGEAGQDTPTPEKSTLPKNLRAHVSPATRVTSHACHQPRMSPATHPKAARAALPKGSTQRSH